MKAKAFCDEMRKQIPNAECQLSENRLQVKVTASFNKEITVFEKHGLSVQIRDYSNGRIKLLLSPSAVEMKDISAAVSLIKRCLE